MAEGEHIQYQPSNLEKVFEATAHAVGDAFLHSLCDQLCLILGVRFTRIGKFIGDQSECLHSIAFSADGNAVSGSSFRLEGSPCSHLIDGNSCRFTGDLSAQFPLDAFIVEHRIRCYIGVPILSQSGDLLGAMAIMHDDVQADVDDVAIVLDAFAARVGSELERIRKDHLLQTSERRLSTLIGNLPGMVYRCRHDRDWTMSFLSEGAFELTGYSPEDFINNRKLTFASIIHPEERENVWNHIKNVIQSDATFEVSYRIKTASGSERWMWESGRRVDSEDGDIMLEGYIRDITEQKEAEIALIDAEERSGGVLRTAVDAIITMDVERRIESFNPAAEKMFGYSSEEVIGKNVKVLMPSPYREQHDGYVNRYVETGEKKIIGIGREVVAQRKDGSTFPIDLSIAEVILTEGRLFTGIIRDLTKRKEAEEAVRRSEKKYRSLVAASATTIWTTGADGTFVTPQDSWEGFTGQPWEEHRGWGWTEMFPPDDRSRISSCWIEALSKSEPWFIDGRIWCAASGEYHYFEASTVPIFDDDGEVVEWIGTTTDVHERRLAEEKLRENEERLSLAFEASNDCLWDYDMVARKLVWNEPFEKVFAGGDDINAGDPLDWWMMRNHPDDRERVRSGFDAAAADCGTIRWQGESRFRMNDGRYATILTRSMYVRDENGRAVRSVGILQDISEQRAIDEALLRVSEDEKRRIGRDIHDDLCQQLFGIQCSAQMLEEELDEAGRQTEAQRVAEIVKMIGKANQRARQTAHGLAPVSLHSEGLVGALSQLVRDVETAHGIHCEFHHEEPGPECSENLVIQLYRIAQEALQNSIRHGKAKSIDLDLSSGKGVWRLRILDDGIGIPDNISSEGMGILTMAHRAKSVGASLRFVRRAIKGTEVSCSFPASPPKKSQKTEGEL